MHKKKKIIIVISLLIFFGILSYFIYHTLITRFCLHADGHSCNNITLSGAWYSENNYDIKVEDDSGSLLNPDHPIFENTDYCQLALKKSTLSFEEFKDKIERITNTSYTDITNVTETTSTESKPYTMELKYNQCYGWRRTTCPGEGNIKKPPCFFYQITKINPNEALQTCEKTKLRGQHRRTCYYITAIKFADIDTNKASELCSKTVFWGSEKDECLYKVASKIIKIDLEKTMQVCDKIDATWRKSSCYIDVATELASTDVEGAIEICEKLKDSKHKNCRSSVISIYSTLVNLTTRAKKLLLCLEYNPEDITENLICNQYIQRLYHGDLLYIYGNRYPEKARIFCKSVNRILGGTRNCSERINGVIKEINRGPDSILYQFLVRYPNGLGENIVNEIDGELHEYVGNLYMPVPRFKRLFPNATVQLNSSWFNEE